MVQKGTIIFGIILILIGTAIISQVTIPSIYYNAEQVGEGINEIGDEANKEDGNVGGAVVSTAWSIVMIYLIGYVGTIFFVILTILGFVALISGIVKK